MYSNLSITSQLPRNPTSLCPRIPKALPQPPEDKRDKVICEFIRTEETYVRHLDIIWQVRAEDCSCFRELVVLLKY